MGHFEFSGQVPVIKHSLELLLVHGQQQRLDLTAISWNRLSDSPYKDSMRVNDLETAQSLNSRMIILDLRNSSLVVNILLASVTVPSFLMRPRPDEGERLTAVWASRLRLLVKHAVHAQFQRANFIVYND